MATLHGELTTYTIGPRTPSKLHYITDFGLLLLNLNLSQISLLTLVRVTLRFGFATMRTALANSSASRSASLTNRSVATVICGYAAVPRANVESTTNSACCSSPASSLQQHVASALPASTSKSTWQRRSVTARAAAVEEASNVRVNDSDVGVSQPAGAALEWAMNFARASETYEVHSWMLLLGLLKQEKSTAASVLRDLGLDDLYGAWHEVLWALHSSDGLTKRAFSPDTRFSDRAFRIVHGSINFARFHSKARVGSEDLLLALAAGHVLEGIFPDLPGMKFEKVRKAVEKRTGRKYVLPDDPADGSAEKSLDGETFL